MKSADIYTLAAVVLLLAACDHLVGTRTYEDCILESMKGVTSDAAAKAIAVSCRKKFPEKKQIDDIALLPHVINALNGHAGPRIGGFGGTLYNGDKEWVVTQLTLLLQPKPRKGKRASLPAREYNVDVTIQPLTSTTFDIRIDTEPDIEFDWTIVRGRGYLPEKK